MNWRRKRRRNFQSFAGWNARPCAVWFAVMGCIRSGNVVSGRREGMKAYVLITAEVGTSPRIQEELQQAGIPQVDSVAGTYDLVAVLESEDPKAIGELVMGKIQKTHGVL